MTNDELNQAADILEREMGAQLVALLRMIRRQHGVVALNYDGKKWMFTAEYGHEAPDSPMVGAAAYGLDEHLLPAIQMALRTIGNPLTYADRPPIPFEEL